jgi:uncharacterized protein (DUF924 family)
MNYRERKLIIEFYDINVKKDVHTFKSMAFEHSIQLAYQNAHVLFEFLNVS